MTNAAFDEYLIKNEQQPVLRTKLQQSSTNGQHIASVKIYHLFIFPKILFFLSSTDFTRIIM